MWERNEKRLDGEESSEINCERGIESGERGGER